jgi:hypothetical protein
MSPRLTLWINRERMPDNSIIVTTEDGVMFRCMIAPLGRENEPRWIVFDVKGVRRLGPPALSDRSPHAVREAINAWWLVKKETGLR